MGTERCSKDNNNSQDNSSVTRDEFGQFFDSSQYCDVIVEHDGYRQYKCHRVILAHKSPYFEQLFEGKSEEKNEYNIPIVHIQFVDPYNAVESALRYIYTGTVAISTDNCVSLKMIANLLQCEELSNKVVSFLDKHLSGNNVFTLLDRAIGSNDLSIQEKCTEFIAKHIDKLLEIFEKRAFSTEKDERLPVDVFIAILGSKHLLSYTEHLTKEKKLERISNVMRRFIKEYQVLDNIPLLKQLINAVTNSQVLTIEDTIMFLRYCDKVEDLKVQAAACAHILASNFHALTDIDNILQLSASTFVELISYDDLFIKNEDQVFDIAERYVQQNSEHLSPSEKNAIMKSIRYTFLSINKLKQLKDKPNEYLSADDMLDALWTRIGRLEGDDSFIRDNEKPCLRPRKNRVFIYQKDFDKNGILYWLGSNYDSEPYINPMDRGYVTVVASANCEVGKVQDLISWEPSKCNLVSMSNGSVRIQFKSIVIQPTKYTIRHTMSRNDECLRNWKFQGSVDGVHYTDLSIHINDCSLATVKGSTFTWSIDPTKATDYYRYFQLLQTGNNSSNNCYLSMGGLEIYGLVRKFVEPKQAKTNVEEDLR
jgi:hypothetical protein